MTATLGHSSLTALEHQLLARLVNYSHVETVSAIWPLASSQFNKTLALWAPYSKTETKVTYFALCEYIQQFAAGLQTLRIQSGDRIALFSENSPRWLIADQGIMTAGGINVVRSSQADGEELRFILKDSGSTGLVLEDLATLKKVQGYLADLPIRFVILLSDEPTASETNSIATYTFSELLSLGDTQTLVPTPQTPDMIATLMYTSGTTGQPKGVMLTHANLLHQIQHFGVVLQPQVGDRVLSLLPTWHAYERTVEYFLLSQGCTQIYTSLRHFKQDLVKYSPEYMIGVPRLWESLYDGILKQIKSQPSQQQRLAQLFLGLSDVYIRAQRIAQGLSLAPLHSPLPQRVWNHILCTLLRPLHQLGDRQIYQKIRAATGGNLKQVISGGGALAMHLDTFFEIVGVDLLVGYGLTETSPVLTCRRPNRNLRGSAGQPLPGTHIRIVDPETSTPLPPEQKGLVLARGPQVMAGYYQNPEATAKVLDRDGWFNTGDLGWLTPDQNLVLTGRAKDTIVLSNGENIEPQPIEDACIRSPFIAQMMLVGQDQRVLGALIVPDMEALQEWAVSQGVDWSVGGVQATTSAPSLSQGNVDSPGNLNNPSIFDNPRIEALLREEINREVQKRPGYRPVDRVGPFRIICEPFSMENGLLTRTLKVKRPVVMERYRDMINGMFMSR